MKERKQVAPTRMQKEHFVALIAITYLAIASPYLQAEVSVDMTAKDIEAIKGTLRVRDLVVNDTARVYGGSLCKLGKRNKKPFREPLKKSGKNLVLRKCRAIATPSQTAKLRVEV